LSSCVEFVVVWTMFINVIAPVGAPPATVQITSKVTVCAVESEYVPKSEGLHPAFNGQRESDRVSYASGSY